MTGIEQRISKQLRADGTRLGRKGLAERIIALVNQYKHDYPEGHYKEGVILAGRLHAIALACRFDPYWEEKALLGFQHECSDLRGLEAPDGESK